MRGISEEKLRKFQQSMFARENGRETELRLLTILIDECKELREPWMTLEEFLKSGFEGWCWIKYATDIHITYFANSAFQLSDIETRSIFSLQYITHIQPIYKPEPPR